MSNILFHSDDYGINIPSSQYILNCCDEGALQSVAILANSPQYDKCCQLLLPYVDSGRLQISVHMNLVEGRSLSTPDELSILTDDQGYFCHSFESLCFFALTSKRKQLRQEIKKELSLQIAKVQKTFPRVHIALDSHQHFHMIPLVFSVVLEIVREQSLDIRYIRVSGEPLMPFITTPSIWPKIRPINIVKNVLLNTFMWCNRNSLRQSGIPTTLFWGLMFSGDMNLAVVTTLWDKFQKISDRRNLTLEVLSHPCPIPQAADCLDPRKEGFVAFYTSQGRYDEAHMLKNIRSVLMPVIGDSNAS